DRRRRDRVAGGRVAPWPQRARSGGGVCRGARPHLRRGPAPAPCAAWLVRQRPAHPARGQGGAAGPVRQLRRRGAWRHRVRPLRRRRHRLAGHDHPSRPQLAPPRPPVRDLARPAGPDCAAADRAHGRLQRVVAAQPRSRGAALPCRAAAVAAHLPELAAAAASGPHRVLGMPAARRGAAPPDAPDAARLRPSAALRRSGRGAGKDAPERRCTARRRAAGRRGAMSAQPEAAAPPAAGRWSTPGLPALPAGTTPPAPLSPQPFLPALPAIQASFASTTGIVQLTLSLSILANAVANLAYGPLSDHFGRRPVLLVGLVAFVVGSLGCALAPSIESLIVARIVQSVGGAAGMVLARAIVRDLYDRERSASVIAYLTMTMVVAPMLAPTIGAIMLDVASWRAIFYLVTAIGAALLWPIVVMLAETRPPQARRIGGPLSGAGALLRSPTFLAYALQSSFGNSIFFSFLAGAQYFMIDVLGRSPTEYGLWF